MKPARQQISEYLQLRQAASAAEIARALQTSAANIRHHLAQMIQAGTVGQAGTRPALGRGRPTQVYALSSSLTSHNLDQLASALLTHSLQPAGKDERQEKLRALAQHLAGSGSPARNLTQRLGQAIQRLNQLNYRARWEAHAQSPQVILAHCPYAAILASHPELCQLDAALLEALLQTGAIQVSRLEPDTNGLPQCIFALRQPYATRQEAKAP